MKTMDVSDTLNHLLPVPLEQSYRLMNHGPTVLVSAEHAGQANLMAAAWACVLDFGTHPKVTVVLDKATVTRGLIEASGAFALQLPTVAQAPMVTAVGSLSARDLPDKAARHGVEWFRPTGVSTPLVAGCVGWLACRLRPEPHNQQVYDLFIGDVVGSWADRRVFQNGRWVFEQAPDAMRTIHHVAGGHYRVTGDPLQT